MINSIAAQIALLAFALAIVAGLAAGNSPATVLTRALIAMFVGMSIGKLVAWTSKLVLRDHLQHKKRAIDEAHDAAAKPSEESVPGVEAEATVEAG